MIPGQGAALAAVVVTAVLWGTTGTAATFSEGVSPLATGAAALGIGGILQGLVALRPMRDRRAVLRDHPWLLLLGAVGVVVYPLTFYSSMHLAGVAVGTVISLASAPLFAGLLEWVVSRRPPSARWFVAVVTGVVGAVLLCTGQSGDGDDATAPHLTAGVLLGLAAGASYALYSWAAAQLILAGAGRAAAMGAVFGTGGVLLLPVLVVTGGPILDSPGNLAVAAYMALVPMFLGYVLYGVGLTRLSPSTTTTVTLLEPAVAAVLAVTVVGERLSTAGWTGLALIAVALLVLVLPDRRSIRRDHPRRPRLSRVPR
ncbi:DMT family transporter [Corynebacterium nuruki]|uniref:DMT family transporter n=1 Tax=Corynebacterium nuruki TaxID=1032851 RepID=UPI0039BF0ECB